MKNADKAKAKGGEDGKEKNNEKIILTVFGRYASEKIIEKSRFLAFSAHTESEEEARAFLSELRSLHPFATHCCFAFIADKAGTLQRFSDDGEPQGTAGIPILEVLKNKSLFETTVAVVRYFGGVKLGAGGLVRAYSSSAAENLAASEIRRLCMLVKYRISAEYTGIERLQKYCSSQPCSLLSSEYGEKAHFFASVKKSDEEAFLSGLIDCMQGRVEWEKLGEEYGSFPLDR